MVKKLFKYEFSYFAKMMFPFFLIMPIAAMLNRCIQFLEPDEYDDVLTIVYGLMYGSTNVILYITVMLSSVMLYVAAISRFYKNHFSAEGYLTMTLPVTESAHIFAKLTTATSFTVFHFLWTIICYCISKFGVDLREILKAFFYLVGKVYEDMGFDLILICFEFLLAALLSVVCTYLIFYTCICIGQLAKKLKILVAFGVYYGYYLLTQISATLMMIVGVFNSELVTDFIDYIDKHFTLSQVLHFGGISLILIQGGFAVITFIICKTIMKRKLNLE